MDALFSIFTWLSDHEAGISAVVGIAVLAGIVLAGVRSLVLRRGETAHGTAPIAAATEAASAIEAPTPDLDPLTVPGFEGRPAIAVLAFDNLSGDPDQEYFADGIAEDLITRLSALRWFPVIARNSSFTYKGQALDVKQVSRELGARYVLEGSVRKAGDRARIAAQLIDATTGAHVWAETYDRELEDIFQLQDEITQAIVASIQPELFRSEQRLVARKEPQSLDAWDCVVRGRWHVARLTRNDNEKARSFFEKATQLELTFAGAFSLLAVTYLSEASLGWTDSRERSIDDAERLARRSLELDERDLTAHMVLALAFGVRGQQQRMIEAYEQVIELNPSNTRSYGNIGLVLSYTGRPDEAIAYLERAMRLSPKDEAMFQWFSGMGWAHFAKGQYEEAASWLERGRQAQPDFQPIHRALAATYAQLDRMEETKIALQEDLRLNPAESVSFIKEQLPYADPDFLEPYLDGLRKAGMPE
jgi:adenylate cyclase